MSWNQIKADQSTVNNLEKHSPYVQIAAGAGGGFVTGFIFFRVSKLLAICVGGAILTVEVAVQAGLVTIDWKKVVGQQETRQRVRSVNAITRSPLVGSERSTELELIEKAKDFVLSSARLSVAFLGGFLLGFGFA